MLYGFTLVFLIASHFPPISIHISVSGQFGGRGGRPFPWLCSVEKQATGQGFVKTPAKIQGSVETQATSQGSIETQVKSQGSGET